MHDHNSFSFTWRGLYEFKESARKEIVDQFKSLSDYSESMNVQFDPMRNSFTLIGPKNRADEGQQAFIALINSFIEKLYTNNLGSNQYLTRGKIIRPSTTQMFVREVQWSDDPKILYKDDHDEISEVFEEIRHEVEGVRFEKYHKWTPKFKETFRECFFPDGVDAISQIAQSTRCVMKVDWVTREVNIGAHSQIALDAGLEKLNLAEKYFNWDYKRYSSHIINSDGRAYFEIRLVPISKQATTILKTTLFPPTDQYSSLGGRDRLASARLAEYNAVADKYDNVVITSTPTYNHGHLETEIWKGYKYHPHVPEGFTQEPSEEPLINIEPSPSKSSDTVVTAPPPPLAQPLLPFSKRPTSVAPSIIPSENATGSLSFGSRPQDIMVDLEAQQIDFPTLAPKRKARNPRGGDTETSAPSPSVPSLAYGSPSVRSLVSDQVASNQVTPTVPQASTNPARGNLSMAATRPGAPSDTEAAFLTARRPRNARNAKSHRDPGIVTKGEDDSVETRTESASIAGSVQTERTFKTMSFASASTSAQESKAKQEYQTRTYKNTQNQQAPRRKANFDNFEALQKHHYNVMHKVFGEGFEDVRRFSGELKFEAKLGRICFPMVPKKFLKSSFGFQWANWEAELERAGIRTLFTDILSISPSDADFVVDLKVSKGDSMFENPPSTRKVSYEIEGLTFKKIPFTIVINAETFEFEVRGKEENFGNVYVNCPCSIWDADFCLYGFKIMKSLHAQAQQLVERLEVEPDLQYPAFICNTKDLGLEITRCVCRRQTYHMIVPSDIHLGHEFSLVVTENIEMKLQERDDLPGIIRFCAVPGQESFRENKTWYTMSVVSDQVDQIFWKNRTLGITELTDTAAKDVLFKKGAQDRTMLQVMFQVVCYLISKINNVGYDNVQYTEHTA